jgi:UDP-N-acetylglucosamine--N-acetylmuramyl-(pentapeptide) pyrophosphoryl-undecaprenol N-acetylglucosamine transferase
MCFINVAKISRIQRERYQDAPSSLNIQVEPFIHDMAKAYSDADLIICRAGALTVTEVATAGLAAVFVPLPIAVDDHQTANAWKQSAAEQQADDTRCFR